MSIEQATADLTEAAKHISEVEKVVGKSASPRLRSLLESAFMRGVRHGRDNDITRDRLGDLLGRQWY